MATALQEFVDARGVSPRVDREKGVIHGVKILGYESKNGRKYTEQAVERAKVLYEGSKVNINHPAGEANAPRGYQDRLGKLSAVEHRRGDGLYGDLHYNPKHALAEQLAWDAEHSPENLGLSHNIQGRTASRDGRTVVEEISRVISVDLVADPATVKGLFESEGDKPVSITLEAVKADPAVMKALREEVLAEHQNGEAAKAAAAELKSLKEQVDQFKAKELAAAKRSKVDAAIKEAKLPTELVSDVFVESCLAADEAGLKKLIEDRAGLVKLTSAGTSPTSREQNLSEGVTLTGGTFADRIRA